MTFVQRVRAEARAKRGFLPRVPHRRKPRKFTDEELLAVHATGVCMTEAARELGVNWPSVQRRAAYLGLVFARKARATKFTDDQLRAAHAEGLNQFQASRRFKVTPRSVYDRAIRLKLVFVRKVAASTSEFTDEYDSVVHEVAAGTINRAQGCKALHTSAKRIETRAQQLGVVLPLAFNKPKKVVGSDAKDYTISVGNDRLLKRLYSVFGKPRNEVYPGTR